MRHGILFGLLLLICTTGFTHPGIGIVQDSRGTIYYTDLEHVWKISPEGKRSIAVKNVHTHELYIDASDNLYGEHEWYNGEAFDTWGNSVWCLSATGELQDVIPPITGFLENNTLVRDSQGNSYFKRKSGGSERLMRETTSGEKQIVSTHEFTDIRWLHYSNADNSLYAVDDISLKRITENGVVESLVSNLRESGPSFENVQDRHYVFGIWTDDMKSVYIALYGAAKVKKIRPDGSITTLYDSPEGWSPSGGMVAADGSLWFLEFSTANKTRVRKLDSNGIHTVFEP